MNPADHKRVAAAAPRVDSTLQKGLRVLEALARTPGGRGVTDLANDLGLTKSNTFRLLQTLTTLGYVRHADARLYAATMKVWHLGHAVAANLPLAEIAAPSLRALAQATGEAVYLAVPDGISVIYIDKIDGTQPIQSFTPKGGSAPMHCVATGKALLAATYDRLREQIRDHLVRYTDTTITSIKRLDADMEATQQRGYAIDRGEYRERIWSFGAAVTLPDGDPVAAVGVSAPDVNLAEGRGDEIGRLVCGAAADLTRALAQR